MGKTKGLYKEEFSKGSAVRIADRPFLENFLQTWELHNRLEPEQLNYANQIVEVESVNFYHGGDELYKLKKAFLGSGMNSVCKPRNEPKIEVLFFAGQEPALAASLTVRTQPLRL
jgi:hypothetical protein